MEPKAPLTPFGGLLLSLAEPGRGFNVEKKNVVTIRRSNYMSARFLGESRVMRAIIFEDDPSVRLMLTKILEKRGWKVASYTHPGEFSCPALKDEPCAADPACCDVILSDKNMPVVAGIEFFRSLCGSKCSCKNIAMMSGCWTEQELEQVRAMGFRTFEKPAVLSDVVDWLEKARQTSSPND